MAEALQVYRTLLKAIRRNITSATGNRQWYIYAKDEFRRHRAASEDNDRAELLQLARDYAFMINGVKDHTVRNSRNMSCHRVCNRFTVVFSIKKYNLFAVFFYYLLCRNCCFHTMWEYI